MQSTTVRISAAKLQVLRELSVETGETMQAILERAIEQYRRQRVLEATNAAYAALRADPEAWSEILEERAELENTLSDGLQDE